MPICILVLGRKDREEPEGESGMQKGEEPLWYRLVSRVAWGGIPKRGVQEGLLEEGEESISCTQGSGGIASARYISREIDKSETDPSEYYGWCV